MRARPPFGIFLTKQQASPPPIRDARTQTRDRMEYYEPAYYDVEASLLPGGGDKDAAQAEAAMRAGFLRKVFGEFGVCLRRRAFCAGV